MGHTRTFVYEFVRMEFKSTYYRQEALSVFWGFLCFFLFSFSGCRYQLRVLKLLVCRPVGVLDGFDPEVARKVEVFHLSKRSNKVWNMSVWYPSSITDCAVIYHQVVHRSTHNSLTCFSTNGVCETVGVST
jgi:hypothetical protein